VGGARILTDPTFDAPGGKYSFGPGTGSTKTAGPAVALEDLGRIDAVLLSHDQHEDNLDVRGREALAVAGQVLTTTAAERRLGGNAVGLRPWESARVSTPGGDTVTVMATPAQHGHPLVAPLSGPAIGFVLEWPGQAHGSFYVSGDTVWFPRLAEIAERRDVGTGMLHFGGVRFPISGPLRYTMNAAEGLRLATALDLRTVVPIHFEDWSHFREPQGRIVETFADAGKEDLLRWPRRGEAIELDV
jgi:L-ascorbate metabolism protein UlaG (beta-lactamase superfamily)